MRSEPWRGSVRMRMLAMLVLLSGVPVAAQVTDDTSGGGGIRATTPAQEHAIAFLNGLGQTLSNAEIEQLINRHRAGGSSPERVSSYRQMQTDIGAFRIESMQQSSPLELTLAGVASASGRRYEFSFTFEKDPPHRVDKITIRGGGPPARLREDLEREDTAARSQRVRSEAAGYLKRLARFGFSGAALIEIDGETVISNGYGMANRAAAIPMTDRSVVALGSITKQFTAAAVLKLEMLGRLKVPDRLADHLPDVPEDKSPITLHQLLTHTAGLVDVVSGDFEPMTRTEQTAKLLAAPLLSAPGERFSYSNGGYNLLAAVIEQRSGMSFDEFLRTHLFEPAGMHETGFVGVGWEPERIAHGYSGDRHWGTILDRPHASDGPYWGLRGAGGVHTTLGDLSRWLKALRDNRVLSEEAASRLFGKHVSRSASGRVHYGYGWIVAQTPRETRLAYHGGGNDIYSAELRNYVDESVVVFAFSSDATFRPPAAALADIAFGYEYEELPAIIDVSEAELEKWAGRYRLESGEVIEVTAQQGRLQLAASAPQAFSLVMSGRTSADERSAAIRDQTVAAVGDWMKKDFEALRVAVGPGVTQADFEERHNRLHDSLVEQLGEMRSHRLFGAYPIPRGLRVVVEQEMERGSRYMQFDWEGPHIGAMLFVEAVPVQHLYPLSADSFVSYQPSRSAPSVEVRFEGRDVGARLVFETEGGKVSAQREE